MVYIESNKNQEYLLPTKITDLFSKNHVCYLIDQISENIDYSEFDKKYAGAGRPAYHPRINIKLLLMGSVDGIRSSRKIAKNTQENIVYIYLAEKTQPDFRTISDFRKNNQELVKQLFLELNKFALAHGMIDLNYLIMDGTKLRADANNKRIVDKETLEKLAKYIDRMIEEGIKVDEEEDKLYGDRGIHQLPDDFSDKEKRRPIVRKIVDEVNKAVREGKKEKAVQIKEEIIKLDAKMNDLNLKKYNFTDPDARFMKNDNRAELCYNGQVVTDKNGLIIATNVVQNGDDRHQLVPNIEAVEENFGKLPEGTKVIADAGFESGEQMEQADKKGFDLYIPGKNAKPEAKDKKFVKANFFYDEEKDVYICPENKILKNIGKTYRVKEKRYFTMYQCKDCQLCSCRHECCSKTSKQKLIQAIPEDKLLNRIKMKLLSEEGKALYKIRQETVERVFGDIKHNKKFRRFLLRGIEKVKIEFNLGCIAHNLVIINNLLNKKQVLN